MSKTFISYDYQDSQSKKAIDNWNNQGLGTDISFSSEERQKHGFKTEKQIKKAICDKINNSDAVLVLVGNNTHDRPWVDYEVHHAKCQKKQVFWTQIPGTKGAAPEEIRKTKDTPFEMDLIQKIIRKTKKQ